MELQTQKTRKAIRKRKFIYKNGETRVSMDDLVAPSYGEIKRQILKTVGEMPKMPDGLPKGTWTPQALKVLEERYLIKDENLKAIENPEKMVWRVSWEIASGEARWGAKKKDIESRAQEFYKLMVSKKFLPNSPTLMNAGTGNGLQYSACFVLPVEDSMEGIFDALKYQALIHKTGGGTGFSFSRLRPSGAIVKTSSGTASGPVSFMRIFDAATNEVKQGGKRRGANMGILRVDHPDILEFIHCKESGGITNFNISVAITDAFMKAYLEDGDYEMIDPRTKNTVGRMNARKVFDEIAEGAWKTGDPGLIFLDRINAGSANPVPALGPVEATNPCVTGDTLVSTEEGLIRIEKLVGRKIKILSDGRLSDVKFQMPTGIIKTGEKQVYKLVTKEGYGLRLTSDHKILTADGWIKASDLENGDEIFISNRKSGFGLKGNLEEGRIIGWLVGDGTMKETSAILSFFGYEKQELAPKYAQMVSALVNGSISVINIKGRDEARVQSDRLARYLNENGISRGNKLLVPEKVFEGSEEMQKGFLQAIFTADGHVENNLKKGVNVRLTSISEALLKDVQRLLLNFKIFSRIYTQRRPEQKRLLPDGHGGRKEYLCKAYHDLVISKSSILDFANEIGFLSEAKNIKLADSVAKFVRGPYKNNFVARFVELIKEGVEPVYDLTEPATSSFIANGLVVHNCGEQPLYPFDACNLGSIFLGYFVHDGKIDWEDLRRTSRLATRFLDNVIEVNPYPLEQIRKTVFNSRRIGLGVGGWSDMLVELGIPFDSNEALELAERVMGFIHKEALDEDRKLAKERGAFPLFPVSIYRNEVPRRNSTITTIAPTGTISIIAGASSGVEPMFAIAYQHIVRDKHLNRKLTFVEPRFERKAKEGGFYSEELMAKVGEHGVVRDMEEIPEEVRNIFGTAHEIDIDWHIKTQAAFQKYTENAVSKTINLRHDASVADVKKAYLTAWETGCKGITIFRDGSKDAQVLNLGIKEKEEEKPIVMERPLRVDGATYRIPTPLGVSFITVNQDSAGNPFEVFITIGKAGSEVAAMAEALGRLISTTLRFGNHKPPIERAREIMEQLKGIGGGRSVGFGPNKIRSLPDAVSRALSLHFGFGVEKHAEEFSLAGAQIETASDTVTETSAPNNFKMGDICPSCGASALVYEEGCAKCHACGYSEC